MSSEEGTSTDIGHKKFIALVKSYPCIYDFNLEDYNNKDMTESSWRTIARVSGLTVSAARERWRRFRDGYTRSLKPFTKTNNKRKPYYLRHELEFLKPFVNRMSKKRQRLMKGNHENDYNSENEEECEDDSNIYFETADYLKFGHSEQESNDPNPLTDQVYIEEDERSTRKRTVKVEETSGDEDVAFDTTPSKTSKETNHRELFLLSLLPEVEKLNDGEMLEFKVDVLCMLKNLLKNKKKNSS